MVEIVIIAAMKRRFACFFPLALFLGTVLLLAAMAGIVQPAQAATVSKIKSSGKVHHGIAMHGLPRYPSGFAHFKYVNPNAPKGGKITFASIGSFDSLNPLIIKGVAAAGLRGYVYESLMARSFDEPFSLYGLIAQTIEVPKDRSWVAFKLHRDAKFSDGKPITVDDVVFSWKTLRDKGRPNHRTYYSKVAKIERPGPRTIKFIFDKGGDREIPLILGLMPIIPKHFFGTRDFEKTTLNKVIGSGPYVIDEVKPGALITYKRNPDYWGAKLAVNQGRYNFDLVRYEYFRDTNAAFEAFKKGLYQVRGEGDPKNWATSYDFPAVKQGRVKLEEFKLGLPSGMSALVFNTRRPVFKDKRVRAALTLLFDFEWINKNLYFGLFSRTQSYFDNSELGTYKRPASKAERKLLAPYMSDISPDVLNGTYQSPVSNGSGRDRRNLRKAVKLLKEAGYHLRNGSMVHAKTGKSLEFEILVVSRDQERLVLSFARSLKRAGIQIRVRQVDSAQFQRRLQVYDYDMVPYRWYASLSPGNEQSFYWGSASADRDGTRNYMGAKSAAIDAMIIAMLQAKTRSGFVTAVRALDRALLSGVYVIPLFHLPNQWVAKWQHIHHPKQQTLWGMRIDTWWNGENQK